MRWLLIRLLSLCGEDRPADALDELAQERRGRGRLRSLPWAAWQLGSVAGWALRDRWLQGRPTGGLHPWLSLRLAARNLRHRPGVPVTAALTLALGYGAAAAIFSVYHGFGRPLPVPAGESVVRIRVVERGGVREGVAAIEFELLASATDLFEQAGAFAQRSSVIVTPGLAARRVSAAAVTPELHRLLGVTPTLGSLPGPETSDAVLIGDKLWHEVFDADPGVVGRQLRVDGRPLLIGGVMPAGHEFPYRQQIWLPFDDDADWPAEPVLRLAAGTTKAAAAAALDARWQAVRPDDEEASRILVDGYTEARGEGGERMALLALLTLVLALLLVSCSNVSNLLLARASSRARALALHSALGAGPGQVRLQLLSETMLIALLGAGLGLGVAAGASRYIESTLSDHWGYYWMRVETDFAVVGFTLLVAIATAVVAGAAPMLRVARADLIEPLKQGASVSGSGSARMASWLLTGQVAFSVAAVVIAALMAIGLLRSRYVEAGFPAEAVRVSTLTLDGLRYQQQESRALLRTRLVAGLRGEAEIEASAIGTGLPGLNAQVGQLSVDGVEAEPEAQPRAVLTFAVSEEYAHVFDLRLLSGRWFLPGDQDIAVVSADLARRHLEGNPLGRRIRLAGVSDAWLRVVGVVDDVVIYDAARDRPLDWAYVPVESVDPRSVFITYRPAGDAEAASRAVERVVAGLDDELPLSGVMGGGAGGSVREVLLFVRRLFETTGTLAILGGVAAAIVALLGLYSIIAFEIGLRLPEFGVRMALGADRGRVLREVVARGLWRVAPGLAAGLLMAWAAGPMFGLFSFGATSRDPLLLGVTAAFYLAVATLASLLPARRAAGQDPASVLRRE